jgi:hypothetical protein
MCDCALAVLFFGLGLSFSLQKKRREIQGGGGGHETAD